MADERALSAARLGCMAAITWTRGWAPHTLRPQGQSLQMASCEPSAPAMGRRISRPSRTSREMLSPADAGEPREEATAT